MDDTKEVIAAAAEAALRGRVMSAAKQRMEIALRTQWENGQAASIAGVLNNLPLPTATNPTEATTAALGVLRRLLVGSSFRNGLALDDVVYQVKRAWFREIDSTRKMQRARAAAIDERRKDLEARGVPAEAVDKIILDMFGAEPAALPAATDEEREAVEEAAGPKAPALVDVSGSPLSAELAAAVETKPT